MRSVKKFFEKRKELRNSRKKNNIQYKYITRLVKLLHKYKKMYIIDVKRCLLDDCDNFLYYTSYILHNIEYSSKKNMSRRFKQLNDWWNDKRIKIMCCECYDKHKNNTDLNFMNDIKAIKG